MLLIVAPFLIMVADLLIFSILHAYFEDVLIEMMNTKLCFQQYA